MTLPVLSDLAKESIKFRTLMRLTREGFATFVGVGSTVIRTLESGGRPQGDASDLIAKFIDDQRHVMFKRAASVPFSDVVILAAILRVPTPNQSVEAFVDAIGLAGRPDIAHALSNHRLRDRDMADVLLRALLAYQAAQYPQPLIDKVEDGVESEPAEQDHLAAIASDVAAMRDELAALRRPDLPAGLENDLIEDTSIDVMSFADEAMARNTLLKIRTMLSVIIEKAECSLIFSPHMSAYLILILRFTAIKDLPQVVVLGRKSFDVGGYIWRLRKDREGA